jgi:hypothetical protein
MRAIAGMKPRRNVVARSTYGNSFLYNEWPLLVTNPAIADEEEKTIEEVTFQSESDCTLVASSKAVSR